MAEAGFAQPSAEAAKKTETADAGEREKSNSLPNVIVQNGFSEREQSMAPSQRANSFRQSSTRRFTSPLDSTFAHQTRRAGRYADAQALQFAYVSAAENSEKTLARGVGI